MVVRETSSRASSPPPAGAYVCATELDRLEPDLEIEHAGLTLGQREALEIDDSAFRIHSLRG